MLSSLHTIKSQSSFYVLPFIMCFKKAAVPAWVFYEIHCTLYLDRMRKSSLSAHKHMVKLTIWQLS